MSVLRSPPSPNVRVLNTVFTLLPQDRPAGRKPAQMAGEEGRGTGRGDDRYPRAAESPPGERSCDDGCVHENCQGEIRLDANSSPTVSRPTYSLIYHASAPAGLTCLLSLISKIQYCRFRASAATSIFQKRGLGQSLGALLI